jgi:hypothetical protein
MERAIHRLRKKGRKAELRWQLRVCIQVSGTGRQMCSDNEHITLAVHTHIYTHAHAHTHTHTPSAFSRTSRFSKAAPFSSMCCCAPPSLSSSPPAASASMHPTVSACVMCVCARVRMLVFVRAKGVSTLSRSSLPACSPQCLPAWCVCACVYAYNCACKGCECVVMKSMPIDSHRYQPVSCVCSRAYVGIRACKGCECVVM